MPKKAICKISGKEFEILDSEIELCKTLGVPLPEFSPTERFRTLMSFRNEWKLYHRKCDATGEDILSAYSKDSPYKVYKNKYWWSDAWNALDYGRDFDFKRPFFEQFKELQLVVPREGTSVFNSENCDYNSHIRESKNCYLNSLVFKCENLYYSYWVVNDINVFDSAITNDSTLCYYCQNVNNSYNCFFLEESNSCNDCYFSYQLRGCKNCIFSNNLANKTYYAFNKQCTEKEFEEIKNKYLDGSNTNLEKAKEEFKKIRKNAIHRSLHNLNCENCTGDHLYNCKKCENAYEGFNSELCVNSISLGDATSVHSCYSAGWPNCPGPVYMSLVTRAGQFIAFCNYTWFSSKLLYCDSINACNSCFGCTGLNHKNYCILNKQYSKEEYEKLVPKIIEHMKKAEEWGQFFPKQLSVFAYNETPAQDFFPLTKEEATKAGFRWRDEDKKEYKKSTILNFPENINEVSESFCKEILACKTCEKNYKIIEPELQFYKQSSLPIPQNCPDCRYKERALSRNPFTLFTRQCDNCKKEIQSTYSKNREEKVYCDECFLKNVE
ncbi:MAG: hypothetical protein WC806_00950 [Candidatus Gracilibacteria bacterium]|jgi:hypothetical protein